MQQMTLQQNQIHRLCITRPLQPILQTIKYTQIIIHQAVHLKILDKALQHKIVSLEIEIWIQVELKKI